MLVMKKKISLLLVLVMILAVLPVSSATASAAEEKNITYIVEDFESGTLGSNVTASDYKFVDGPGASVNAVKMSSGSPEFDFYMPYGYTFQSVSYQYAYDISAWIYVDSVPASNTVEFVYSFNNPDVGSYTNLSPTVISKTVATVSDALQAGQWVKVEASYQRTADEVVTTEISYKKYGFLTTTEDKDYAISGTTGKMSVKVGDGTTPYVIDDFVVMPKEFYYPQYQTSTRDNTTSTDNGVSGMSSYTFDKREGKAFYGITTFPTTESAAVDGCYIANGTGVLVAGDGTNIGGTVGADGTITGGETQHANSLRYNSLKITSDGTGTGRFVRKNVDVRFGTLYDMSVWVKAETDNAVGAEVKFSLDYSDTDDTENLPAAYVYELSPTRATPATEPQTLTVTKEWRRFFIQFTHNKTSYNTVAPDLVISLEGEGLENASYSIYTPKLFANSAKETVITPTGSLRAYPKADGTYSVQVDNGVHNGGVTESITRIMMPYEDDFVIIKTLNGYKNDLNFDYAGSDVSNMLMKITPKDKDDFYGGEYVKKIDVIKEHQLTAVAEIDQTVWAPDMPYLTATIRYNAASGSERLIALCGMYDKNNKMVSSDIQEFALLKGEGEIDLRMDITSEAAEATEARVYLWEAGTYAPRKDSVATITKTTQGNFVYVDPKNGTENTTYGYNNPVATVAQGVEAHKNLSATSSSNTYVILLEGDHKLTETIEIDASHTPGDNSLIITSYNKNKKSVITGGEDLTGEFSSYQNGIWRASVPVGTMSRQLYVDGTKAVRARSEDAPSDAINTTTYWPSGDRYIWYDTLENGQRDYSNYIGVIKTTDTFYKDFAKPKDLELVFYSYYSNSRCHVDWIEENSDGTISFHMQSPGWEAMNHKGHCSVYTPAYIENALELLDTAGEWYLDSDEGYIYYMPYAHEDMSTAEVVLPTYDTYMQKVMNIEGTTEDSVQNITFDNVEFSYFTWNRPSYDCGHSEAQDGMIEDHSPFTYSDKGATMESAFIYENRKEIPGCIEVRYANNVDFTNCSFNRLGNTCLRLLEGAKYCGINGSEFYCIGGGAVSVGSAWNGITYKGTVDGSTAMVAGKSYFTDEPSILEYNTVENNYIHHTSNEFWGAAAITVGHPRNSSVSNNEICYIPYSALHVGYGWDKVYASTMENMKINNNYIHDLFQGKVYDGAAIYTLGKTNGSADNPNEIRGNFVERVGAGGGCVYHDQGSSGWYVEGNVMDISNNFSETCPYSDRYRSRANWCNINVSDNDLYSNELVWENNYSSEWDMYVKTESYADTTNSIDDAILLNADGSWCDAALSIMASAGIKSEYKDNYRYALQEIRVVESVELSAGKSIDNTPVFMTSKNAVYKNNGIVIDVKSDNESVATATVDKITAIAAGTATITYTVIENGVARKVETKVTVK